MRFFIPQATTKSLPEDIPGTFRDYWQDVKPIQFEHMETSRSYSLASSQSSSEHLEFIVKLQVAPNGDGLPGVGSHYLGNLAVGQCIEALGPFEEFFAKEKSERPMVFIGAGSGIAPLRSILADQLNQTDLTRDIHFYYGARYQDDLVYADEYFELSEGLERFHYVPTLSQPDASWLGATGYVQQVVKDNIGLLTAEHDIKDIEFYLCGPQAMMSETISLLKALGADKNNILFDSFE